MAHLLEGGGKLASRLLSAPLGPLGCFFAVSFLCLLSFFLSSVIFEKHVARVGSCVRASVMALQVDSFRFPLLSFNSEEQIARSD